MFSMLRAADNDISDSSIFIVVGATQSQLGKVLQFSFGLPPTSYVEISGTSGIFVVNPTRKFLARPTEIHVRAEIEVLA